MQVDCRLAVVEFVVVVGGDNWWFGLVPGHIDERWRFVDMQVDLTNIADV